MTSIRIDWLRFDSIRFDAFVFNFLRRISRWLLLGTYPCAFQNIAAHCHLCFERFDCSVMFHCKVIFVLVSFSFFCAFLVTCVHTNSLRHWESQKRPSSMVSPQCLRTTGSFASNRIKSQWSTSETADKSLDAP
jgi:hypothetical protein